MRHLYLDIETIPVQNEGLKAEIMQPHLDFFAQREAGLKAELETIRPPANYKDPAKIDEWNKTERPKKEESIRAQIVACQAECVAKAEDAWRRTSFDGALGQMVVASFAIDNDAPRSLFQAKNFLTLKAEGMLLREFFQALELVDQPARSTICFVGHNVVDFDLRFIWQRAVVHGIQPPWWIPFGSKPWGDRVFDTMVEWAGQRGRVSQDKLCRILGIDAKGSELGDEIDGSRVWDFIKDGRIAEVAKYCGGDVIRAREIHQRLTFAQAA